MSAPELQKEAIAISLPEPWWKHVSDAIRGVPHDYTEGPIGRSLLLLAVPMVLETLMESLRYVIATMRRELGDGASKYIKETSSNGQFEFRGIPFGTYQMLVQAMADGEDIIWSRTVDVQTKIPIFVDLGKPVS